MWWALALVPALALGATLPSSVSDAPVANDKNTSECTDGVLSPGCLKFEAISIIDKLDSRNEIVILPGVSIVQDQNGRKGKELADDLAASLPSKGLDKYLLYKLGRYLDSHSIKLKMFGDSEGADGAQGEARKKIKGIGKKGGGLFALAMLMKGTLMSLGLGALALLAGKALMTAIMSLVLSAILGLKSLTSGKSTTYEIVAKPVYSQSHSHSTGHEDVGYGHSAYGRSFNRRR